MQYAASEAAPAQCAICQDPRQFVPASGQQWTTIAQLRAGHRNAWQECEPGLLGIGTVPEFAIGQRALLLRTAEGNFLWDCIALLDAATIEIIRSLGGLRGIAISHPHYYTTVVEWSRAFDDVPIHLHEADREWVLRPDGPIQFRAGEQKRARAWGEAGSLRRTLSRWGYFALARRRARTRCAPYGRHSAGDAGWNG